MNEFSLIEYYFKAAALKRSDVIYGIGDDAACLRLPAAKQDLLVSTDTLVAEVHFLSSWDPYDIAYKAVMVNVSDIAAMAAKPCWLSLALTLPEFEPTWLERFSQGLHAALQKFGISLIGGDTTRGPLSLTLTIHGQVPRGRAVRRIGAKPGDRIYVSGLLGVAALAVSFLQDGSFDEKDRAVLMQKLQHPWPRIDLAEILQDCASAAIDISDGLSADLNHICVASGVGACLVNSALPIHPLVTKYKKNEAASLVLSGGDDYELCFTVPASKEEKLMAALAKIEVSCYPIGWIEEKKGLYLVTDEGAKPLTPRGYSHF